MKASPQEVRDAAEALATQVLSFIAGDGERLGRFLATTGIGPAEIRAASVQPEFLSGVLEYLASDERLLTAFAAESNIGPETIDKARHLLGGGNWEREVP
jgi:hypothetical protein